MNKVIARLDKIVCEELEREFPDTSSLPLGYDRIMWSGFHQGDRTANLWGAFLLRPSDWKKNRSWFFQSLDLYCQDFGGIFYADMSFPSLSNSREFDREADSLARLKIKNGIESLKTLAKRDLLIK